MTLTANPTCGKTKKRDGEPCTQDAGWGTAHQGEGSCKYHEELALSIPEHKDGIYQVPRVDGSYATIVKHKRLGEFLKETEIRGELNNLDGEIILTRALISLLAEQFGSERRIDEEGQVSVAEITGFLGYAQQAGELNDLIRSLTSTIEKKFKVMELAREVIPRSTVAAYINQIILVLTGTLKNRCGNCGFEHHMKDMSLLELEKIGGL